MTGLAFPTASLALGLGDIHVTSALGQPLDAQIELIDANAEDTARLTARVLDEEEFRLHGLERPLFLSRSTLAVGRDAHGDPALILHSIDGATEPVVTLLVGVRLHDGELVREYTLLLDPAEPQPVQLVAGSLRPAVAADISAPFPTPAPEAPITSPVTTAPARARSPSEGKPLRRGPIRGPLVYTVAAHDTLDRIARRAGARAEVHRMAIAIYRANPEAFHGNLNLLRLGATLRLPSAVQLSAITAQDAEREYTAQMHSWQAGAHGIAASATLVPQTREASYETQVRALAEHVQALQRSLSEVQQELKRPVVTAATNPVGASPAGASAPARDQALTQVAPAPAEASNAAPDNRAARIPKATLFTVLSGALVLALGVWFYGRRRNPQQPAARSRLTDEATPEIGERAKADAVTPSPQTKLVSPPASEARWFTNPADNPVARESAASQPVAKDPPDPTVKLPLPGAEDTVETEVLPAATDAADDTGTFAFFNPQSLEDTAHLVMGTGLKEPAPLVERRKNPADVLRQAIEREPHRSDLRVKLLELYYAGAAQNRRAFLEAAQQLAKNAGLVTPEDWSRITDMGRALVPDNELFSDAPESKAVA